MQIVRNAPWGPSVLLFLTGSCTGTIGDLASQDTETPPIVSGAGGSPPSFGTTPGTGGSAGTVPTPPESAGVLPLRRLTRREYNNTIFALVGAKDALPTSFPPDVAGASGFIAADLVSTQHARIFWE